MSILRPGVRHEARAAAGSSGARWGRGDRWRDGRGAPRADRPERREQRHRGRPWRGRHLERRHDSEQRFTGIVIRDNSTAEVIDSSTQSNGISGFDVFTSSSLILRGTFTSSNHGARGGEINGQSIVELRGAQVTLTDNAVFGIIAGSRSHLAVFGFQAAAGSTLNVSGSGLAGIGIAHSTLTIFSDTVVTATNNGVGLLVVGGQVGSPTQRATFVLHDNGVGMSLSSGTSTFLRVGLNVHDNATGILVDDASLNLEAAPGLPTSIVSNGTNVQLAFGARSTIQNFTIGTPLVCEPSVLSRGTSVCP
jgi:hypothetical protein